MGGSNPYIEEVKYTPATKKYKVTFLPSGKTIEVDPAKIPYGHNGIPGSILDISEGIKAGLDHAWCGVLGVPRDWCATVMMDPRTGLGWAGGYTGHGVAAANLAGRTLADLDALITKTTAVEEPQT